MHNLCIVDLTIAFLHASARWDQQKPIGRNGGITRGDGKLKFRVFLRKKTLTALWLKVWAVEDCGISHLVRWPSESDEWFVSHSKKKFLHFRHVKKFSDTYLFCPSTPCPHSRPVESSYISTTRPRTRTCLYMSEVLGHLKIVFFSKNPYRS